MGDRLFIAPDSAAVINGKLIPGQTYIKALVDQLREEMQADPSLRQQFKENPRTVLGDRGIVVDLQDEILREGGLPVEERPSNWCISTGSCCCSTL